MAIISSVLARLKREPLGDLPIAEQLDQLMRDSDLSWRERLLTPLVTLRLFLIQILNGNCAIAALRQLSGTDFAPSSYCEARDRLPLHVLQSLLQWMSDRAAQSLPGAAAMIGRRIFIGDGSTFSTADTQALRDHFALPSGVSEGVGYPMGKLMGLLDAATGMFTSLLALPLFQHDLRGAVCLHAMLRDGDILLGDRAFCSFAHVALLNAKGVFSCFRLHQRRKATQLAVQRWEKPLVVPAWMTAEQFQQLPAWIEVRLVRHTIEQKGYRTQQVLIATTLMDREQWSDAKIAEMYGSRWQIETCFNHLKTTMKMNQLKCQSVEGVMKELAIYLAAYNLVRLAMLKAAKRQDVVVWRISFIDAMRLLQAQILGLSGVCRLIINPDRRGRHQLRVIRRRHKEYDLLKKSRRDREKEIAEKAAQKA